jgi:hypothetical protein
MKRLILFPICFVALAVPVVVLASGAQGGFDGVVSLNGMHVAEIDDFHADVDGEELNRMVQQKLGSEWERVIRETSRKGNSQTMIYMHPEGQRMGLFVLDLDGHEMDVVQVSVDPNHLSENIGKYEHHRHDDSDKMDDDGDDSN